MKLGVAPAILFMTGRLCLGLPITGGYFWAEGAGDVMGL